MMKVTVKVPDDEDAILHMKKSQTVFGMKTMIKLEVEMPESK